MDDDWLCMVSPWQSNGSLRNFLKNNPAADRLALVRCLPKHDFLVVVSLFISGIASSGRIGVLALIVLDTRGYQRGTRPNYTKSSSLILFTEITHRQTSWLMNKVIVIWAILD